MGRAVKTAAALLFVAAIVAGGVWLWTKRPWRIVASVNGTAMTARSKAANEAYGEALQEAFESVTLEYAEGFEVPNLLDYLK